MLATSKKLPSGLQKNMRKMGTNVAEYGTKTATKLRSQYQDYHVFLNSLLICEETRVHNFTPEPKRSKGLKWRQNKSLKSEKTNYFKVKVSLKVMSPIFSDSNRKGETVKSGV